MIGFAIPVLTLVWGLYGSERVARLAQQQRLSKSLYLALVILNGS
jgi:hypothetical protein